MNTRVLTPFDEDTLENALRAHEIVGDDLKFTWGYCGGDDYVVDLEQLKEADNLVLPGGEILHVTWVCDGTIEKMHVIGSLVSDLPVEVGARKLRYPLAREA